MFITFLNVARCIGTDLAETYELSLWDVFDHLLTLAKFWVLTFDFKEDFDFKEKAELFKDFFTKQCSLVI